jgi:hypothetical protein
MYHVSMFFSWITHLQKLHNWRSGITKETEIVHFWKKHDSLLKIFSVSAGNSELRLYREKGPGGDQRTCARGRLPSGPRDHVATRPRSSGTTGEDLWPVWLQ